MSRWISAVRCNNCKEIYPEVTTLKCKCGEDIAMYNPFLKLFINSDRKIILDNKVERIMVKKRLFSKGWKVKKN